MISTKLRNIMALNEQRRAGFTEIATTMHTANPKWSDNKVLHEAKIEWTNRAARRVAARQWK